MIQIMEECLPAPAQEGEDENEDAEGNVKKGEDEDQADS